MGKHMRRAWQSSPRSRAATVQLGRCNRWPLSAGPWQQGGCGAGTVARSGAQAWALCSPGASPPLSCTGPSAHLPAGSASRDSLLSFPTAKIPAPEWGRSTLTYSLTHIFTHTHVFTHTHIHSHLNRKPSLTDLDTASILELSSHRGLSHEDIPTDSKSQMHKHATADTNVAGLEMQAQSCEPTCTVHPTRTPEDAMTQPSRLSRNLPSRWAAFEGKSPQA